MQLYCVSRWNVYIYIYILQKMIHGPSNVKHTVMYNLSAFNQRRHGYVFVGEGNSQQIESEERLT